MGLMAYTVGLPVEAKSMLTEALNLTWGEGIVTIQDLSISSVRMKIRNCVNDPSVVFIVLDSTAKSKCEGIDNGLFTSNKFCEYKDTVSFVQYLNSTFGTSIEYEDEMSIDKESQGFGISEEDLNDAIEEATKSLHDEISFKDLTIRNLKNNLEDLKLQLAQAGGGLVETVEDTEEIESLRQEIITLKNDLLESNARAEKAETAFKESKGDVVFPSDYEDLKKEVVNLRSKCSMQSSVVDGKEDKIVALNRKIQELEESKKQTEEDRNNLFSINKANTIRITELEAKVKSNEEDSARLVKQMLAIQGGKTKEEEDAIIAENEEIKESLENAREELNEKNTQIVSLTEDNKELERKLEKTLEERDKLSEDLRDKEKRIALDEGTIQELNERVLSADNALSILNDLSGTDEFGREVKVDKLVKKLASDQSELTKIKEGAFYKISEKYLPNVPLDINLLPNVSEDKVYENINFIFAGNAESQRSVYKPIKNGFAQGYEKHRKLKGQIPEYLLVDLVTETCADYEFGLTSVARGINWLQDGGSLQNYISSIDSPSDPALRNVKILLMHLNYVNDAYFLTVDWEKRLEELNNSGYQVYMYCGNLSNMVSRILFESFVPHTMPNKGAYIYVSGTTVSSRCLIANSQGLTRFSKAIVIYFNMIADADVFRERLEKRTGARTVILNRVTRPSPKNRIKPETAKTDVRNFGKKPAGRPKGGLRR